MWDKVRLFVQSPKVTCLCGLDQDTDNPEVPNGTTEEPVVDGEELNEAVTRKTRRKRWVPAGNVERWWCQSLHVTVHSIIEGS